MNKRSLKSIFVIYTDYIILYFIHTGYIFPVFKNAFIFYRTYVNCVCERSKQFVIPTSYLHNLEDRIAYLLQLYVYKRVLLIFFPIFNI